ncbi:MAG: prepilin-type N-terminal cleavage/methylation domain-containing protein [Verrucomicrobiia bacterium]
MSRSKSVGVGVRGGVRRGFSLVEMLVALTVLGLLSALSIPTMLHVAVGMRYGHGIYAISETLEQARSHAMAHGTHVWVAMVPKVDGAGGVDGVFMSLFASADRTSDFQPQNLVALARPSAVRGAQLTEVGEQVLTERFRGAGLLRLGGWAGEGRTKAPGAEELEAEDLVVLRVDPRGSMTMRSGSSGEWETFRWLEIGLMETRRKASQSPNLGVIQISGLTGQVLVFR